MRCYLSPSLKLREITNYTETAEAKEGRFARATWARCGHGAGCVKSDSNRAKHEGVSRRSRYGLLERGRSRTICTLGLGRSCVSKKRRFSGYWSGDNAKIDDHADSY